MLGHDVGLHFDLSNYKFKSKKSLKKKILTERSILENCIEEDIKLISFHKPGKNGMPKELVYYGMINIYNAKFTKNILYYSDSKGGWKFGMPTNDMKIMNLNKSLQLLIHPIWWISKKKFSEKNNSILLKNYFASYSKDKLNYLKSYKKFS